MFALPKFLFSIAALAGASFAVAAPVNLGVAGQYNVVSFGDFNSTNNQVAGAVAVAGDMTVREFTVNGKGAAQSLVVGGDLGYSKGTAAGNAYVGGTRTLKDASISGQWSSGTSPVDFNTLEQQMRALSGSLSDLASTSTTLSQYGGLYMRGSGLAVEVFDLGAADLTKNGWSNLSGVLAGSTLIFNIGGSDVTLRNGMLGDLSAYNVLLNFYEAQTLTLQGMSLQASILAPEATLYGSGASVNGNVVVGDWEASITLNNGRYFQSTEVVGYTAPATTGRGPNDAVVSAVPEPGALALVALGLVALVAARRRRSVP